MKNEKRTTAFIIYCDNGDDHFRATRINGTVDFIRYELDRYIKNYDRAILAKPCSLGGLDDENENT